MEYCSTCANTLPHPSQPPPSQPLPEDRRVECCARIICGKCIHHNNRFADYCPYCQVSNVPSTLPQGLKDPPSYASSVPRSSPRILGGLDAAAAVPVAAPPPPYATQPETADDDEELDEKEYLRRHEEEEDQRAGNDKRTAVNGDVEDEKATPAEDTLHFVDYEHDSINSLSLRYNVPASALRRANNITSDHLLLARRTVVIPGEYYKAGVSLSPRPIGGEEEEQRKGRIRRFMTTCKVADYDVAQLYLEQADYDIEAAAEAYFADEAWEKAHPNSSATAEGSKKAEAKKKPSAWSRFRK